MKGMVFRQLEKQTMYIGTGTVSDCLGIPKCCVQVGFIGLTFGEIPKK